MVTKEQVLEYLKEQAEKELEEDKLITQELIDLAASKGRQIIAVIQTHQNGLVANAIWGVQKIK
jgi:hypothetical protein